MSQHKGPKGPAHRAVKIEAIHHEPLRPYSARLPAHLRNLASREQRRGLKL
jgi:hypothetical protein